MRCIRILPDTWARTLWPLSITTRNIALGSGSTTLPCTSIASSLLMLLRFYLSSASWTEAQCGSGLRCRRCSEHDGSRDLDSPSDRRADARERITYSPAPGDGRDACSREVAVVAGAPGRSRTCDPRIRRRGPAQSRPLIF